MSLALANLDDADLILNDSVDDAILRVVTKPPVRGLPTL
jgi:hypothetical protein